MLFDSIYTVLIYIFFLPTFATVTRSTGIECIIFGAKQIIAAERQTLKEIQREARNQKGSFEREGRKRNEKSNSFKSERNRKDSVNDDKVRSSHSTIAQLLFINSN